MQLPITAIVVFRNEARLLDECLRRLSFVSQVLAVDMMSTDGSLDIARRYTHDLYQTDPGPIADPVRVEAERLARFPWVLIVDPDEHHPPQLAQELAQAMRLHPEAGGFRLPWRFYFKGRYLPGTVWGGRHLSKLVLIHRRRGRLLPTCNKIIEVLPGYDEITLPNTPTNHIRHYWSNSYRDLLRKHVLRYPSKDAQRMHAQGVRFGWRRLLTVPAREFLRCFRHRDGWRLGPRGWALSAIYGLYHLLIEWHLRTAGRSTPSPAPHPGTAAVVLRRVTPTASATSHAATPRAATPRAA